MPGFDKTGDEVLPAKQKMKLQEMNLRQVEVVA